MRSKGTIAIADVVRGGLPKLKELNLSSVKSREMLPWLSPRLWLTRLSWRSWTSMVCMLRGSASALG